jgi:hypothetical protein
MELELESEFEMENQAEPFLGGLLKGVGGLLGLGEGEGEFESELEAIGEGPLHEGPLGEGAFGEGEGAFGEGEMFSGLGESEFEGPLGEYEGEQFFGKIFKKIAPFVKKALPVLKNVAKIAAPIVGTAIGGPIGGKIGSIAGNLLGEGEYEGFGEFEMEGESEAEMEAALEAAPLTEQQALGELMAAAASKAYTDMEAEAQIGSAAVISLSHSDRDALRAVLLSLNRGVAALTQILRRRAITRPFVRTIPTIVKRTAVTLKKQAAAGQPVTKKAAARAMATQTRRVLGNPAVCTRALQRNMKATRAVGQRIRSTAGRPRPSYAI